MSNVFSAIGALLISTTLVWAQDEAALRQRVQARSQAVVDLLSSGIVEEGSDGLLQAVSQLDPQQSQTVQAENQDRRAVFTLISQKTKVAVGEVARMYAARARKSFPPNSKPTGYGPCRLVPAKPADIARLLQYLKQGMIYASQKKFDLALAEFQQAINIDKNFLGLHQNVGSAQLALKKYAEAEAAFDAELKLIECLAPLDQSQLNKFAYYIEVADKDPAQRVKVQVERLREELRKIKAETYYSLACLYSQKRVKDRAIASLRAAVDAGFSDKRLLSSDPDLGFVRSSPEFREIIAGLP